MIAESPKTLLILLAVLTLLGAVIGYCVAMIVAKRQASKAIEDARLEFVQDRLAATSDLQAKRQAAGLRSFELHTSERESGDSNADGNSDGNSMSKREKSLELQSQIQARRIEELEVENSALEEKQRNLLRKFADNKSAKSRDPEVKPEVIDRLADTENLPTLSRKVELPSSPPPAEKSTAMPEHVTPDASSVSRELRSYPASREIDIPTLAESELEDSGDVLNQKISGAPGSGARGRG